jgi:DNA polymerase III subunit epsilon
MTDDIKAALELLNNNQNYQVLTRVATELKPASQVTGDSFKAAFIDLETTGLDPKTDEIIEIGTLIVSFTNEQGFIAVEFEDNQLQQPSKPISEEITAITGITNEDVAGKAINWQDLAKELEQVNLVICHNAAFDRNFLELQTPAFFSQLMQRTAFGCSARDVNWRTMGFEGAKLEYLNLKLGYFYDGHRALVDCWATFNILDKQPGAFDALKQSVREKQRLICAINADYDKKDELKKRGYRWSNGQDKLPKCWWTIIAETDYEPELAYLHEQIYYGREVTLPTAAITAYQRYSYRAQTISTA